MNNGGRIRIRWTSQASVILGITAWLLYAFVCGAATGSTRSPAVGSTVTATAAPGGSISPDGPNVVTHGDDIEFTVAPTGAYHILDVEVDGVSVGPVTSYTFVSVTNDHTINVFFHIPWATEVVSYTTGTNAHQFGGQHWFHPASSTGEPSRTTTFGWDDVTMFNGPYETNQLVSIGSEGELVITFDHDVRDDPYNPHGIDILVFGNCMFQDTSFPNGMSSVAFEEPGRISVSQDGNTWRDVSATSDSVFPTLGFTDTPHAHGLGTAGRGSIKTSFVKPVDPAADYSGKTYAQLVDLYDGSGGGSGVDISETGLDWIRYVKIWQPSNESWSTEVDAISDVAPSLLRDLNVTSSQTCSPPNGTHSYTSGIPVTCYVPSPVIIHGSGTQIVCTGWAGTASVPTAGTGTSVRFTIAAESSIEWTWETSVQLTANASEGGSVSPSNQWHIVGSNATVTATPSAGYSFSGWTGDVYGNTNSTSIVLTMDQARTVTASFAPLPPAPSLGEWLGFHNLTNETEETEAGLDRDEDGFDARSEYLAGTDPGNPESLFKIINAGQTNSYGYISWLGGTNGSADPFAVWSCSSLTGDWDLVEGNLKKSATGTNTWITTNSAENIYLKITVTGSKD